MYIFSIAKKLQKSLWKSYEKIYTINEIQTKSCTTREETNKYLLSDVAVFYLSAYYMSYTEYVPTHIYRCQSLSLNPVVPAGTRSWLLYALKEIWEFLLSSHTESQSIQF